MNERPDADRRPTVPPQPGERRRLERAPGERYAAPGHAARRGPVPARGRSARANAVIATLVVADAGAVLFFMLGLLDLGLGMVAVAAFVGWVTGVAAIWWGRDALPGGRWRPGLAAGVAGGAIVLALLLEWGYALVQGGVLGPVAYASERYGIVAPLSVAGAALAAALRAR